jgi:hypothetical protein
MVSEQYNRQTKEILVLEKLIVLFISIIILHKNFFPYCADIRWAFRLYYNICISFPASFNFWKLTKFPFLRLSVFFIIIFCYHSLWCIVSLFECFLHRFQVKIWSAFVCLHFDISANVFIFIICHRQWLLQTFVLLLKWQSGYQASHAHHFIFKTSKHKVQKCHSTLSTIATSDEFIFSSFLL